MIVTYFIYNSLLKIRLILFNFPYIKDVIFKIKLFHRFRPITLACLLNHIACAPMPQK
jgi:hypothetical protein